MRVRGDARAQAAGRQLPLKQLRDAGIVEREKRGSYAYFSLADGALQHVCALLGYVAGPVAAAAAA